MKKNSILFVVLMAAMLFVCLFLAGAAPVMIETDEKLQSGEDYALVTFIRASGYKSRKQVQLWDGTEFIGIGYGKTVVQYRASPGEHLFIGHARNWAYMKADLEAGKHYIVLVTAYPILGSIGTSLDPLNAQVTKYSDDEIKGWLESLLYMAQDPEVGKIYKDRRVDEIQKKLDGFNAGSEKHTTMNPGDYKDY